MVERSAVNPPWRIVASCYRRCGKRVFEANQEPVVEGMHLFECLTVAEAESISLELLKLWLRDLPEFDPEGWALRVLKKL